MKTLRLQNEPSQKNEIIKSPIEIKLRKFDSFSAGRNDTTISNLHHEQKQPSQQLLEQSQQMIHKQQQHQYQQQVH